MKLLDTMVMTESEEQVEKNTSVLRAGLVMSLLSIFQVVKQGGEKESDSLSVSSALQSTEWRMSQVWHLLF